eukprot:14524120-Ditylum_brightwellii.AAC.1
MEETDGCAKQYRCASAINLLSTLSMKYNIVINRAVGAPGYGKDVVDGLNAVDTVSYTHLRAHETLRHL